MSHSRHSHLNPIRCTAIALLQKLEELRIMNLLAAVRGFLKPSQAALGARSLFGANNKLKIIDIYIQSSGTRRWRRIGSNTEEGELVVLRRIIGAEHAH